MSSIKKKLTDVLEILTTERAFYLLIMITMISLPVCELLVEMHERYFDAQPVIVEAAGIIGIIMGVGYFLVHKKDIRYYLTDALYALLIIFAGLSFSLSQDMVASVRGYEYDEFLTHFYAYFSLMFAGTMIRDTKLRMNIVRAFFVVLILQLTLGMFQSFGLELMDCFYDDLEVTKRHLAYGLTQHFNWYVSIMVLAGGCAAGLAVFAKTRKRFLAFLLLTELSFYVMFSTDTRLALVAVAALLMFYPVSILIFHGKRKDKALFRRAMLHWLVMALLAAGVFAVCYFCMGRYRGEMENTMQELNEGVDQIGTLRGTIWKYGLACVPQYWAFGVGLDNYRWCFANAPGLPHDLNWSQGKGHCEFIHILVTQGVFQLLTYLTLYGYVFVTGVRTVLHTEDEKRRELTWIFLAMFTGYLAQSLFNSSIVNIAPYFWITVGLILCKDDQRPFGYKKSLKTA